MRVSAEFRTKLKLYMNIATMITVPTKTIIIPIILTTMTIIVAIQTMATQMTATWTAAITPD